MHVERTASGLKVSVDSEAGTERLGQALAASAEPGTVIALVGTLGAGKTRLSRAIAQALGVDPAAVVSPTFVLIHEYEGNLPVYHFDAYRLSGPEAFEGLGVAEYWDAGGVCLVEWADLVGSTLPSHAWQVAIRPSGPQSREVDITVPAQIAARLVAVLSAEVDPV